VCEEERGDIGLVHTDVLGRTEQLLVEQNLALACAQRSP
jgi:hypothetical protein